MKIMLNGLQEEQLKNIILDFRFHALLTQDVILKFKIYIGMDQID